MPSVLSGDPVAILARKVLNHILHHKRLLQNGPSEYLRKHRAEQHDTIEKRIHAEIEP